jgi:hypothetical protein
MDFHSCTSKFSTGSEQKYLSKLNTEYLGRTNQRLSRACIVKIAGKKKIDRRVEPPDTFLEENHPMTISSKFCSY